MGVASLRARLRAIEREVAAERLAGLVGTGLPLDEAAAVVRRECPRAGDVGPSDVERRLAALEAKLGITGPPGG